MFFQVFLQKRHLLWMNCHYLLNFNFIWKAGTRPSTSKTKLPFRNLKMKRVIHWMKVGKVQKMRGWSRTFTKNLQQCKKNNRGKLMNLTLMMMRPGIHKCGEDSKEGVQNRVVVLKKIKTTSLMEMVNRMPMKKILKRGMKKSAWKPSSSI